MPISPRYFRDYLADRWTKGCRGGRQLFEKIQQRGYRGSRSNMERLLGKWRGAERRPKRHPAEEHEGFSTLVCAENYIRT